MNSTQEPETELRSALIETVRAGWNNDFYKTLWMRNGFSTLDDLVSRVTQGGFHSLPIIRKDDLKQSGDQIMCWEGAVDVVSSSGTTGRPVDIPLLADEERNRVERVQKTLREIGVGNGSRVLDLLSLNDMFALGPQMWLAIKAQEALAIRCQAPRLKRVLDVVNYIKPDVVVGNPHVLAAMAEEGIAGGVWPNKELLPDAAVFAVAATFEEDLSPTPIVEKVCDLWGIRDYTSQYGCSEAGTLAHECVHHRGYHINAADTLIELIDPDTGNEAQPCQRGEVVLTALSLPRGFLLIRYGTNDIAAWKNDQICTCGRTSGRLGPIVGRRDHQLKIKGQTIFPELLLQIVDGSKLAQKAAIGIRKNELGADEASILVVPDPAMNSEEVITKLVGLLTQHLPVLPNIQIMEKDSLHDLEQSELRRTNGVKVPRILPL